MHRFDSISVLFCVTFPICHVVDSLIGLEKNPIELNVNLEIIIFFPSHFSQPNIIKQMPFKLTAIISHGRLVLFCNKARQEHRSKLQTIGQYNRRRKKKSGTVA